MAQKGHIKIIKAGSGGGVIVQPPTASGSSTGAVAGADTPPSAIGDRGSICVTITTDNMGTDLDFNIPYYMSLCLNVGDLVRFDVINGDPKKGVANIPVYLERIPSGVVASINKDNASGTISERNSGKTINFYQAHLSELQINVGDNVKYTILNTVDGEMAVNVQEA
jgi:cold shock CspA family protein